MMRLEAFYYLTIKRNELSSHKDTCTLLSERSQSEKATYSIIPTICHSGKGKKKKKVSGCQVFGVW